jgi:hypothetical protein
VSDLKNGGERSRAGVEYYTPGRQSDGWFEYPVFPTNGGRAVAYFTDRTLAENFVAEQDDGTGKYGAVPLSAEEVVEFVRHAFRRGCPVVAVDPQGRRGWKHCKILDLLVAAEGCRLPYDAAEGGQP